jgi:hypothetical protein
MNNTTPNMMSANGMMNMMGSMTGMMGSLSNMNDLMTNLFSEAAQTLGMSTDQLQNELRDEGGAGLGLSIAKGYVEVHGGNIKVKSTKGKERW